LNQSRCTGGSYIPFGERLGMYSAIITTPFEFAGSAFHLRLVDIFALSNSLVPGCALALSKFYIRRRFIIKLFYVKPGNDAKNNKLSTETNALKISIV